MSLQNLSQVITQHHIAYTARNFESRSFLMPRKYETHNCQWYGLNLLSRLREIVEQGLKHLFITSNSAHFFTKINLEQLAYLFKNNPLKKSTRN